MPRPKLRPDDGQRNLVKSLAACGVPHEQIARRIGLRSPKTLRTHFRRELDDGVSEANYTVAKSLYKSASILTTFGGLKDGTSSRLAFLTATCGFTGRPGLAVT